MNARTISVSWRKVVLLFSSVFGFAAGVWLDWALSWSIHSIGFTIGEPPHPTAADILKSFIGLAIVLAFLGYGLGRGIVFCADVLKK